MTQSLEKMGQPVLDPTSFLSKENFKGIFFFEGNRQIWKFSICEKIITISF